MPESASALVQPLSACALADFERRASTRHVVSLQGLSRPLEGQDAIWWGAMVRDISGTGIGLTLCFPFRPGTYLAVDLQGRGGWKKTLLTRVVYARDQADGSWHVGCELVKPLAEADIELIVGG